MKGPKDNVGEVEEKMVASRSDWIALPILSVQFSALLPSEMRLAPENVVLAL
jgi:hypothetical protein